MQLWRRTGSRVVMMLWKCGPSLIEILCFSLPEAVRRRRKSNPRSGGSVHHWGC